MVSFFALVPKTWASAVHMSPPGISHALLEVEGGEGVQLADRGSLGGPQLATREIAALEHTGRNTHKHERTSVKNKCKFRGRKSRFR